MVGQKTTIAYELPPADESWELPEVDVPETAWHDAIIELLKLVLKQWSVRAGVRALVASNLALRWDRARWKVGVDPDVAVYAPPPPDGEDTSSVCTWEVGHAPPRIAVEVVSRSTATKDYLSGPDRYAASGAAEVWIFDPKRLGPRLHGGPFVLQLWRRDEAGVFHQRYRGDGPCMSPELGAWLVVTDEGMRLRLADDRDGVHLWPTAAEQAEIEHQRAEAERERAEAERDDSAAKLAAQTAELAALRAELQRLRGG